MVKDIDKIVGAPNGSDLSKFSNDLVLVNEDSVDVNGPFSSETLTSLKTTQLVFNHLRYSEVGFSDESHLVVSISEEDQEVIESLTFEDFKLPLMKFNGYQNCQGVISFTDREEVVQILNMFDSSGVIKVPPRILSKIASQVNIKRMSWGFW